MRKRIILSLISIFAFVFFSCSGLLNDIDENSSSNKAYIKIGDTSSRTVLPEALNTDDMTEIKLIGDKDGGSSDLLLLSATTYSELPGKTAEIEPGTWSFELQATINGITFTDSTSCTNKEVSAGDTLRLVFLAMEAGENGNFSVKVNYEGEVPSSVKVFLDDEDWTSYMFSESESYVIVTGSASSGDHKLKIEFYDGNSLWHTFREIIRVKGGLLSEKEYDISLNTSPSKLLREQSEMINNVLRQALDIHTATAFKRSTSAPADGITTYPLNEEGAVAWKTDENGEVIIWYYNPSTTKISLGSDVNGLFGECSALTEIDMSGFDASNVTDMGYMFFYCSALTTLNISNLDTSNVRSMGMMFGECSALTELDLSNFDTSNVVNMADMFVGCAALTTIYTASDADWSSESVDGYNMFEGCTSLVGGKGTAYDSNYTNATYARVDSNSDFGYFTEVGTEKTYLISVNTIVGGTVTVSAEDAKAGTVITLTPEAKAGYVFSGGEWNVRDANGEYVSVTEDNTFIMPASKVTVNATFTVTSITAALAEGAELTITFMSRGDDYNTVIFTRQTDGSYSETHSGWYPSVARASEANGIITIDVAAVGDYNNSQLVYTLKINTIDSTYTEAIGDYSPELQTIEVNGTDLLTPSDVRMTLTKSN